MVKMSNRWVASVREPGRYGDDLTPKLYLRVRPNGSKTWTLRVTPDGWRVDRALDAWDAMGLAEARDRAREWRREARQGRDPGRVRREAGPALTFEAAARAFHELYRPSWAPGHAKRWLASLEKDVFPRLPDKPMAELEPADLVAVLAPIWTAKHDTAKRIRQRIAAVFEWAHAAQRLAGANPMVGLGRLLPAVKVEVRHRTALPWQDVPAFYARAAAREAMAARVLCFQILTAVRPGEARGAQWSEFKASTWTIPAERMKARRPHVVPLPAPALAILNELRDLDPVWVFPSPQEGRGPRPVSAGASAALLRRLGVSGEVMAHGFRSSFRDWCADAAGADFHVAEAALAHRVGMKEVDAYLRTSHLARRAELMAAWGRFVTGEA